MTPTPTTGPWDHLPGAVVTAAKHYEPWLALKGTSAVLAAALSASDETAVTPAYVTAAVEADKEYVRPNGERYLPRTIAVGPKQTIQDVTFVRNSYKARAPILLYGDPGTGKTALIEAALPNLETLQGNVETETADFVGSWVQNTDGTYAWVDGPLIRSMEGGKPFLIDEIALIDPRIMSIVYGVMDGRDELPVTQNPMRGVVKPKEGFVVYGACNPNVPGALMSDALLSRFPLHINVTTDWGLAKALGVEANIIQVARNLHLKARSGEVMAPPQLRELLTYQKVLALFGPVVALQNFVGQHRDEDRKAVSDAIEAVYGTKATALTL